MPPRTGVARVVSIFERARRFVLPSNVPRPPLVDKTPTQGGYALFMDPDEKIIFYAMPHEAAGPPVCPDTNTSTWCIKGKSYVPSRRDGYGNWVFRCIGK